MYRLFFKRALDIILCLIAFPFFCVFYVILAPIIYLTDKGPVFYIAPRVGRNGKVFNMYKFRSMRVNAPDIRNEDGSTYNGADDPRVTKIGKIMRQTSLDETPQIINVLKGDMSLCGPRAFLVNKNIKYEEADLNYRKRLAVRPGITGYSQAYYRNSISTQQKIEYDCYYVDHLSFITDLKIIFQTIVSVLKHENIYVSPNHEISETNH